jgi:hypothetical protein
MTLPFPFHKLFTFLPTSNLVICEILFVFIFVTCNDKGLKVSFHDKLRQFFKLTLNMLLLEDKHNMCII